MRVEMQLMCGKVEEAASAAQRDPPSLADPPPWLTKGILNEVALQLSRQGHTKDAIHLAQEAASRSPSRGRGSSMGPCQGPL